MSQTVDLAHLLSLANQILTGKEYFVSTILGRLDDAAETIPHDAAIKTAQHVMRRRLEKEGSLATITQKQFQEVYDEVCALGNKAAFRELLGDLLITAAPSAVANYNADFASAHRDTDDVLDISDRNMVGEFASLWGETSVKGDTVPSVGKDSLEAHFASLGFNSPVAEVVGRADGIVLFSVQSDSPIGRFTTYVPTEVRSGSMLLPSVFASDAGFSDLNKDNLLAYAQGLVSGSVKPASPQKLLAGLAAAAGADKQSIVVQASSGEDIALESPTLYQSVPQDSPESFGDTPYQELPDPLVGLLSNDVRDAIIEAGLSFGKDAVITAKTVVGDQIRSAGLRLERIAVDSEFDGGLVVSANIVGSGGKKTIQVPVEIMAGQVLLPSVFTSGTTVEAFEINALKKFASAQESGVFNAAFSSKHGWAYKDLYAHVITSATYGNFVEAEDAMAVIAEQYGPEFHRAAFADLSDVLNKSIEASTHNEQSAVEAMIAEAGERARNIEDRIKLDSTLMYLMPQD